MECAIYCLAGSTPTADIDMTGEAQWFCAVHSLLRSIYVRSRRAHAMYFMECSPSDSTSALMDGRGGSAILTEMEKHLGTEVQFRRDFFKRLVLLSAHGLRWPLSRQPSGTIALGFKPRRRSRNNRLSMCAVESLGVPNEIVSMLLIPFVGDIWWGARQATTSHLRLKETENCYFVTLPYPRKPFRRWIPFTNTFFKFAFNVPALIEWQLRETEVHIHTGDIWNIVDFFRYLRNKEGRSRSEIVHIKGVGDVLI